jgi:hypothetical protein
MYEHLKASQADVIMLIDTGLNYKLLASKEQWPERTRGIRAHKYVLNNNLKDTKGKLNGEQYGGTGILAYEPAASASSEAGGDPTKLGRWSSLRIQGKGNHAIRLISLYVPVTSSEVHSVYQQHKRYFLRHKGDNRCPRQAVYEDLEPFLQECYDKGEKILVGLDANEVVTNDGPKDYFLKVGMEEKILKQHPRVIPPATFHRNSQNDTIDTFFGSIGL